jgi:hypothetical protein
MQEGDAGNVEYVGTKNLTGNVVRCEKHACSRAHFPLGMPKLTRRSSFALSFLPVNCLYGLVLSVAVRIGWR